MVDQNSATLITLNVSDLNTPTKDRMVKLEIKNNNTICYLQETYFKYGDR